MLKFLTSESKSVIGAASIVGFFSLASRFMGFIRDRILAGAFGAGDTLDVYYAAFKIPDLLFNLIVVGALSASFIPIFSKYYQTNVGHSQAWKFTNLLLHVIAISMLGISVVIYGFAPFISTLIAPGFDAAKQAEVTTLTRILLISEFFLALSMVFGSVLQSLKRFLLYSLAPLFYNAGIIFGALFFAPMYGVVGLAHGVVLGSILHFILQCVGLFGTDYQYKPVFSWKDADLRIVLRTMIPRVIGIGMNQILFVILISIASTLAIGSVTIFQFAYNVEFFPIGIFGISFAVAAFPALSVHAANGETEAFQRTFVATVNQMLFFLTPATVVTLLLSEQIIRLIVGAGAFDWSATILTAQSLSIFSLAFIAQALIYLLARAFFAHHDTKTPLIAGVVSDVFGISSAYFFTKQYGVVGLAIAFAFAEVVNAGFLWYLLRRKMGSLREWEIMLSFSKFLFAGVLSGGVIFFSRSFFDLQLALDTFLHVLLQTGVTLLLGVLTYLLSLHLLKSPELQQFLTALHARQKKRFTPKELMQGSDGTGI